GLGISDPEGVIDRLRSSGVVTVVEDEVRGTLLKVPTLLAAKLRRDLDSAAGAGPVVASLLDVLVEHMESTGILEAELLGDVLLLARSGGHWSQLLRIAEAVGVPTFLLAPRSSGAPSRRLPPRARATGPRRECVGAPAADRRGGGAADVSARSPFVLHGVPPPAAQGTGNRAGTRILRNAGRGHRLQRRRLQCRRASGRRGGTDRSGAAALAFARHRCWGRPRPPHR